MPVLPHLATKPWRFDMPSNTLLICVMSQPGRWLRYEAARWQFDETLRAFDLARDLCRAAAAEANKGKVATACASAKTVAAVASLARSDRRLAATVSQWDADPWLLNTPGGAIDLRTGTIWRARLEADRTKITAVEPSNSNCPLWKSHLRRILNDDPELLAYLQRVLGYSLTGTTTEHALFFWYGTGANGKGVTVNTVAGILKDYVNTAGVEAFTATHADRHTTELAALRGARLVTVAETEEGRRWAESRIKTLTCDPIRARFVTRQDEFEFTATEVADNRQRSSPGFGPVDEAIRRRFHLIPFLVTIPPGELIPTMT